MSENNHKIFNTFSEAKVFAKKIALEAGCNASILRIESGWRVTVTDKKMVANTTTKKNEKRSYNYNYKNKTSNNYFLFVKNKIITFIVYIFPPLQLVIAFLTNYYTAMILGYVLPTLTVMFFYNRGTQETINYVRAYTFFSFIIYMAIKYFNHKH